MSFVADLETWCLSNFAMGAICLTSTVYLTAAVYVTHVL